MPKKGQVQQSHITPSGVACNYCKGNHYIFACKQFLELDKPTRLTELKNKRLCINCLRHGHNLVVVKSVIKGTTHYYISKSKIMHRFQITRKERQSQKIPLLQVHPQEQINSTTKDSKDVTISTHCNQHKFENFLLLSTAVVSIFDSQNKPIKCRALLESRSQSS
ncbi:hypothetical protein NQ318_003755 [Aromia moschata]|uniref:Uncharacterized protein n=1 Tax=Aromia moschata TaxID=1265417 RepID=A0AAV8YJI8_9CUCU|nr:hypothetical protein NQ318_003755 [Aromia moschata]